jgi:hypothetical protein
MTDLSAPVARSIQADIGFSEQACSGCRAPVALALLLTTTRPEMDSPVRSRRRRRLNGHARTGEDHQAELVDEVELDQRPREPDAAVDEDVP